MSRKKAKPTYRAAVISLVASALLLIWGFQVISGLEIQQIGEKLFFPLTRLSSVQERILTLLGLPNSLYTDLQVG